jgi:predicted DNA-binding protein YlxM (UPF0122 family)
LGKLTDKPVINWEEFDHCCLADLTLDEIAKWYNCRPAVLSQIVRETKGESLEAYKDRVVLRLKIKIANDMIARLDKDRSPVMLIWMSKNLLGWNERQAVRNPRKKDTSEEPGNQSVDHVLAKITRLLADKKSTAKLAAESADKPQETPS